MKNNIWKETLNISYIYFFQLPLGKLKIWNPISSGIYCGLNHVCRINSLWPCDATYDILWPSLVNIMACCQMEPSNYLDQSWPIINEVLWFTWSSMVQVMTYCLRSPSHYLNQCWLINEVRWHNSPSVNSQETVKIAIIKMCFWITVKPLI